MLTRQQFSSALSDLDDSFDRDIDQDHQVQSLRVKLEGAARRLREAIVAGDVGRIDAESTYIAALADDLRKLEDLDSARHVSDRQLWWTVRPHVALKELVTTEGPK